MKNLASTLAVAYLFSQAVFVKAAPAPQQQTQPSNRENFQKKVQSELDELNRKINALEAKSAKSGAKTNKEIKAEIEKLKTDRDAAEKKLEKLKNSSTDMWESVKKETQKVMDQLETSYRKVASKFK